MVRRWIQLALSGMAAVSCVFPNDLDYPRVVG